MFDLFEALGISKKELQDRVVDRLCSEITDDLYTKLQKQTQEYADKKVADLANKHVFPNINALIEDLTLQKTNQWGEKVGEKVTFIEYLIKQAEAYMNEPLDSQGKTREENPFQWQKKQTRIMYLINNHLHNSIESAMKNAIIALM